MAKLEENKRNDKKRPWNIEQLRLMVDAKKGSINTLLDLDKEQLTSTYADDINRVLGIEPPLIEQDGDDEEFIRDVRTLRSLDADSRRALMVAAAKMHKKP